MAVVLELNIDGANVKFRDNAIRSREESIEICNRTADKILRNLNLQYNAKRYKELEKQKEDTAE